MLVLSPSLSNYANYCSLVLQSGLNFFCPLTLTGELRVVLTGMLILSLATMKNEVSGTVRLNAELVSYSSFTRYSEHFLFLCRINTYRVLQKVKITSGDIWS